jgi:hypothetical protein
MFGASSWTAAVNESFNSARLTHPERKIPRVMERGFEGDLVAEGLELGNGPTRFSSLVAASAMGV